MSDAERTCERAPPGNRHPRRCCCCLPRRGASYQGAPLAWMLGLVVSSLSLGWPPVHDPRRDPQWTCASAPSPGSCTCPVSVRGAKDGQNQQACRISRKANNSEECANVYFDGNVLGEALLFQEPLHFLVPAHSHGRELALSPRVHRNRAHKAEVDTE